MKKKKSIKKRLKRFIHILVRIMEVTTALVIVVTGLALGRLYLYPIEIKDYLPTLEKYILPANSGLKLNAQSVTLQAAFETNGILHISMKEMTLLHQDDEAILQLPEVDIAYRWGHLLTLNYTPNDLRILGARLQLMITPEGQVRLYGSSKQNTLPTKAGNGVAFTQQNMDRINLIIKHLRSFDAIALEDAQVTIDDQQKGEKLSLPVVDLNIEKQPGFNHALRLSATADIQQKLTQLNLEAQFNRINRKISFDLEFDRLYLKDLARTLSVLSGADLTVGGHFNGLFDLGPTCTDISSCFKEASFQIKVLEEGTLDLPGELTNLYHLESGIIHGAISSGLAQIKIAKSSLQLRNGPSASLEVSVTGLDQFLKNNQLDAVKTVLKATVGTLPMTQVPDVWPVGTGPDAHGWVKRNLTQGTVEKADFTLYFTGGELVDLYGELPVHGVQVRYLDEMSPVQDMSGVVQLYPDRVLINATDGHIGHLHLQKALADLTDLQSDVSNAHIVLDIQGPVQEALDLIAEKPLEFPQMFGLDTKRTGGTAQTHVDLNFPLLDDLQTKDITVFVKSDIEQGVFPIPLENHKLTNGKYQLEVNNQRLTLQGKSFLGKIPLDLSWIEDFTATKPTDIHSTYTLSSMMKATDLAPLLPAIVPYITGTLQAQGTIQQTLADKTTAELQLDLNKAALNIPLISIQKPSNVPTKATVTLTHANQITDIAYQLTGAIDTKGLNPIQVKGSAKLDKDTTFVLDELIAPKTNLSARFHDHQGTWDITLQGQSWNATALTDSAEETASDEPPTAFGLPKDIRFDLALDRLILKDGKPLTHFSAKGNRHNHQWQNLSINAVAAHPFNFTYLPKKKMLTAQTPDIGDFLTRIGVSEKIAGGNLSLQAQQTETGTFEGTIELKDLSLQNTGFLVQAMTVLGIIDAFRGEDLVFDKGLIPFTLQDHPIFQVTLKEGYLSGTNLGITFDGTIASHEIALTGSVIPAYAINSLPGKIPIIGTLFKDGDGGGLLGVKYTVVGPISKTEVSFDALKSIVPGILGKLFR